MSFINIGSNLLCVLPLISINILYACLLLLMHWERRGWEGRSRKREKTTGEVRAEGNKKENEKTDKEKRQKEEEVRREEKGLLSSETSVFPSVPVLFSQQCSYTELQHQPPSVLRRSLKHYCLSDTGPTQGQLRAIMSIMLEYTLIHVVQVWPLAMNQEKEESKWKEHRAYCEVMQMPFTIT